MLRLRAVLPVVILVVTAGLHPSFGQDAVGNTETYFSGGVSVPLAPQAVRNQWQPGYKIGAGIGIPLSRRTRLRPSVDLSRMLAAPSEPSDGAGGVSASSLESTLTSPGTYTAFNGTLDLMVGLQNQFTPSYFAPYTVAGAGYYWGGLGESNEPADLNRSVEGSAFTMRGGVGMAVRLGEKFGLFAEGVYSLTFTQPDRLSTVPVMVGVAYLP